MDLIVKRIADQPRLIRKNKFYSFKNLIDLLNSLFFIFKIITPL